MSKFPYEDIVNLYRPDFGREKMSRRSRAAQFSRFAAVVGHDKAVEEVSRHTDVRRELDDCEKERINSQLQLVLDNIDKAPYVKITCFIPDGNKAGGEYRTMEGRVKKILPLLKKLVLTDDREIIIEDIIKIETEI